LFVFLKRPDHLVNRVRAQERLKGERCLKRAERRSTVSLPLIRQSQEVVRVASPWNRLDGVLQRLFGLAELFVGEELRGERESRALIIRAEADRGSQFAHAAWRFAVRQ